MNSKAKSKIKSSLNEEKKKISLDGKEILERKLRQLKIKLDDKVSGQMMKFFQINASNDLFYKIGNGSIDKVTDTTLSQPPTVFNVSEYTPAIV